MMWGKLWNVLHAYIHFGIYPAFALFRSKALILVYHIVDIEQLTEQI